MKWRELMLPGKTKIKAESNMQGMHIDMEFDASSLAHIMAVLTDLYSDPEMAVVREYSTNALDSHIAAGQNRPIEITLPSNFSRNFKIKDYGLGLSVEDVKNVYSKYGASTKRNTNEQTGMLGLGCKSALTYADQFIINAVKDGEACSVVVHRSANGSGAMEVLNIHPTIEPNGVEIVIPAKSLSSFDNKVRHFFSFWDKNNFLINGKSMEELPGLKINSKFFIANNLYNDYIVMGGIAYPLETYSMVNYTRYSNKSLVVYVDIGEVDFTPSREKLHFTDKTIKTLEDLKSEFHLVMKDYIEQSFIDVPDYATAIKKYRELYKKHIFSNYLTGIKYKGLTIPDKFEFDVGFYKPANNYFHATKNNIFLDELEHTLLITGYDKEKLHPYSRKKIIKWLDDNSKDPSIVYFFSSEKIDDPWLQHVDIVSWKEIQAIKLPTNSVKKVVTYDIVMHDNIIKTIDSLNTVKNIYYISNAELKKYNTHSSADLVKQAGIEFAVLINKRSWEKFLKKYPNAIHLFKLAQEVVIDYFNNKFILDKNDIEVASNGVPWYAKLDANQIEDPEIKDFLTTVSNKVVLNEKILTFDKMRKTAYFFNIRTPALYNSTNVFSKYELIPRYEPSSSGHSYKEQLYYYMNSWYQTNIKDKDAV